MPQWRAWRRGVGDWRVWVARAVVISAAAAAGLVVVAFTWLGEQAFAHFSALRARWIWAPLVWTPLATAAIVWCVRRVAAGAAGSGIPQVMAALDPTLTPAERRRFVSLKLSLAKLAFTAWGLLGGLSLGREGPSVQVAAGVMASMRHLLPRRSAVSERGLLVAGGAAGIAAAFNTPLAGVMFAIEELSRGPEERSSGLVVAAIVLAGLIAVSIDGNATYFGVIRVAEPSWALLLPALAVALVAGFAGGLFARLLVVSLEGRGADRFSRLRARRPVAFAALCGAIVALIGIVSGGAVFGSGYAPTRALLEGGQSADALYPLLKFVATWLTAWSGVPGGIFAPSLSIGAALGHDIAMLSGHPDAPTLIALGMTGFLAAVTQAPLTAFIIVMEMVSGHALVLTLMACALVASGVSRLLGPPLYWTLAQMQLAPPRETRLQEAPLAQTGAMPADAAPLALVPSSGDGDAAGAATPPAAQRPTVAGDDRSDAAAARRTPPLIAALLPLFARIDAALRQPGGRKGTERRRDDR